MADYKSLSPREAAERLLLPKSVTVLMHARPDADTVGSATALAMILKSLGVNAKILSADPIPRRLEFLTEGVSVAEGLCEHDTLISIDVASRSQLGSLSDAPVSLMIDHHAKGSPFADNFIRPAASSAAEVLLEIIDELTKISAFSMTGEIAKRLYAAMSSDTGGFVYSNASPTTYRKAADLMEYGIDYADINHRLFNSKSENQIKAEGFISSKLTTAESGRIAYATLTKSERESLGIDMQYFDTAIDVVRALMGAEIALFVRETDDGGIRASMRSTGQDVASVAEKFDGGGHIRAAGCSPKAKDADEAARLILTELKKIL